MRFLAPGGQIPSNRVRIAQLALWAVWLGTRTALYLAATAPHLNGDIGIYQHWYACCLSHGAFPTADPMWQYPPGAGLVFWLVGRLGGNYVGHFVFLAIACDLAVTLMLCARAGRGGSAAGAWFWVCGLPLVGAIAFTRFDVVAVTLSVAAICLPDLSMARGALIGAGAAIKIWPVALLAGALPGRLRREFVIAGAVLVAVGAVFSSAVASFLTHQAARGLEIESVAATPLMIWRLARWPGTLEFRFGSWQLAGGHAAAALYASRLGLVLAIAAVLVWRLLIAAKRARWRPEFAADAPLAATLLFLVVSPVLSVQYLLWVIGLAAVCLATGRTTQRPAAIAVLAAAALTQLVFPVMWNAVVSGSVAATAVLAARNVLLVTAAVLSVRGILRTGSPGDQGSADLAHAGEVAHADDRARSAKHAAMARSPLPTKPMGAVAGLTVAGGLFRSVIQ
jgi:hypothetical protein